MRRLIEIRAAEGGDDSKLFVADLARAYIRLSDRFGWKTRTLAESSNETTLEITGKNLHGLVNEAGGHRIQRVPPTEKRGRVHTSTVTVAVIDPSEKRIEFSDDDFRIEWFSGTVKAGGQHRNKHANSCRVHHIPTGLSESRQGRDRNANLRDARAALERRLVEQHREAQNSKANAERRSQVGSGMRGDKTITLRFQDDRVTHHETGKSMKASQYMKGQMDRLW